MLQVIEHLFLAQDICHLSGIPEEIEVFAHRLVLPTGCISKRVIVEIVIRFFELVSKPIVGILKINSVFFFSNAGTAVSIVLQGRTWPEKYHYETHTSSSS